MTVRINKPALNLREELTKAQGVVRYEQRQFWMDGLVENGTFDSDLSGWTANSGASWDASGAARVADVGGSDGAIIQKVSTKIGKTYVITLVIRDRNTTATGSSRLRVGTSAGGYQLGQPYLNDQPLNQVFSYTFTATTTSTWITYLHSYLDTFSVVDNIQVFEVDENDNVIQSLPLGWKPLHVYEDGLLQREGTNHDYTVIDTGFGYQVKPAVAPSATTETCIIAEREL